jgi:integrase
LPGQGVRSVDVCTGGGADAITATPPHMTNPHNAPKSKAGRRVVPFPELIVADVREHLDGLGDGAELVFTSPEGRPLRHSNFYRRAWLPAVAAAGLSGTHFHDLRHTGNALTADEGANLREPMERMGHSSTRALEGF